MITKPNSNIEINACIPCNHGDQSFMFELNMNLVKDAFGIAGSTTDIVRGGERNKCQLYASYS